MKRRSPTPQALAPHLLPWFDRAHRDLPWRRTKNPYRILVSEIMLQQTQVSRVIEFYNRFLKAFPTLAALAAAKADHVLRLWSGLGYYARARNLQATARIIVKQYGGKFPRRFEEVIQLPGIGRYTAGAILSIAYNQPYPAVDANVTRVLKRVFMGRGGSIPTTKEIHAYAKAAVPEDRPGDYTQAIMELGALICLPKRPLCEQCCLYDICNARKQGRQDAVTSGKSKDFRQVRVATALIQRRGKFLIAQRPPAWRLGRPVGVPEL